jgi:signal transduction histidine kinase
MRLKTKLQLSFLLFGLLCVVLTGWQSFEYARNSLETLTFDRLTSIRDTKKRQIESYFHQTRNHVVALSEDPAVVNAIAALAAATTSEKDFRGEKNQFRDTVYHELLRNITERFGYQDLFLVNAISGNIVLSVGERIPSGTNLLSPSFRGSGIASAFLSALADSVSGHGSLIDFAPYEPMGFKPAGFIASAVVLHGKRAGVLIVQLSIDEINNVMTSSRNWQQEGLGRTGETYIVGEDFRMRSDSRFYIQDPEEYVTKIRKSTADSSIASAILSRSTSILLQEVRTEAAREALNGVTDTRIIDDYRGVSVLSSFTPLAVPGVHWVMVSEIDANEAFHPVFELRERLIFLSLALLLGAVTVGMVISRSISRPILSLARDAETFGRGDLSHRSGLDTADEIGFLGQTFNRMASAVMEKTGQMQEEILERKRTEQLLQESHARLRNLSSHLQSVREDERKGIAREIHDELGQALSTLKLDLRLLSDEWEHDPAKSKTRIAAMVHTCDTTIKAVRRIITELRPRLLDDLGLEAAVEWLAKDFERRTSIACTVSIIPEEVGLDPQRSTAVFRIVQEALTNVARHSGATKVELRLTRAGEDVELFVRDNGKGISEAQMRDDRSFGLIGMRERSMYFGGKLEIAAVPDGGTVITVGLQAQSLRGSA